MKNKAPRKKPAVNRVYYIYVGILAVLFFTFHTIPFLKGVMYSFTDWRGYGEWNFVGLRNYIHMFSDVDTGNAYLFTFKFAVITTILVNVISLILALGLVAFIFDTAGGVLFAKFLNLFRKNKVNPMIGAAGISAFPMSSRVIAKMALKDDPSNFILMQATSANVAGQLGSIVAGGMVITLVSMLLG